MEVSDPRQADRKRQRLPQRRRCHVRSNESLLSFFYDNSGDHAGSEAKPGVAERGGVSEVGSGSIPAGLRASSA
jgi:hypothetical protein